MNAKTVQLIAVGVLAASALYYVRTRREADQEASASGTTRTDKTGVTTTPIKEHAVAIVATPFRALESVVRKVASIPASVIQGGVLDRLQPYGDKETAAAAYSAPLRPDYVPTVRALNDVVYIR